MNIKRMAHLITPGTVISSGETVQRSSNYSNALVRIEFTDGEIIIVPRYSALTIKEN